MCPLDAPQVDRNDEMVAIPTGKVKGLNGINGHSNGTVKSGSAHQNQRNPYAPRASDFLSNVSNFSIIESTLRGSSFRFYCD